MLLNRPGRPPSSPTRSGRIDPHKRRIRPICLAAAALLALGQCRPALPGDPQQAFLTEGTQVSGRLSVDSAGRLQFLASADDRSVALHRIRQINFPSGPRVIAGITPPRRVTLRGGEVLHFEVNSSEAASVSLTGCGTNDRIVPRVGLRSVAHAAGERTILYEDFEKATAIFEGGKRSADFSSSGKQSLALRAGDDNIELRLSAVDALQSLAAGRATFRFYDDAVLNPRRSWFVEFEFETGDEAQTIRFEVDGNAGDYRTAGSADYRLGTQPRERSRGWHSLTVLFDARRAFVLLDGLMAGSGGSPGVLSVVRLGTGGDRQPAARGAGGEPAVWIDDLQIARQATQTESPENTQRSDLLRLAEGDELFGSVERIDARQLELNSAFGRRELPWSRLRGVDFGLSHAPPGRPVAGLVSTIEMAPAFAAVDVECDRIVAAIVSTTPDALEVDHPALGRLRLPIGEVQRVEPVFEGIWHLIDAGWRHPGDEIREEFHARIAEGPNLAWTFTLAEIPAGKAWLGLRAADVEPAGPGAARDGRFAKALAAGHLRTELHVNGRRVDDLNRHINLRAHPDNPRRLRIALQAGILKVGENVIELKQKPAADDPRQYDDCEISRLGLEFES